MSILILNFNGYFYNKNFSTIIFEKIFSTYLLKFAFWNFLMNFVFERFVASRSCLTCFEHPYTHKSYDL